MGLLDEMIGYEGHEPPRKPKNCQRWIPVGERLPESGDTVLVWDYGEHVIAWLNFTVNGTAYFSAPGRSNFEVTHWMPMPEPPEVE